MRPASTPPTRRRPDRPDSIRGEYVRHGSKEYYQKFGGDYRNPHEAIIVQSLKDAAGRWPLDLTAVLDLAAGSGEATLALRDLGARRVEAVDPYTADAYAGRTDSVAERYTFADIAVGALAGRRYSLIVCSFAMHLCERSRLPALCYELGAIGDAMLILTPHKRPEIRPAWGWKIVGENIIERVRSRYYLARAE